MLRLKARLGDAEADVLSECLSGLLTIGPEENLAFVCEFPVSSFLDIYFERDLEAACSTKPERRKSSTIS